MRAHAPEGDGMAKTKEDKKMFLYVGAYPDEQSAEADYKAFLDLRKEGWVGSYDVGIVVKDNEGKIDVTRHTDSTGKGTRRGLAVGVLLGIVFPPSILAGGLIGAGSGALIGRHFNDISKKDLKELGDYIEDNEAALVIIGESKVDEMVKQAAKSAIREYKKEFNADADEFNRQLDKAEKEI